MTHVSSAVRPNLQVHTAVPITTQVFPNKTTSSVKMMYCDVVFGSPSMDCNGTGICKITGTHANRPIHLKKNCQLTMGLIAAAPEGKVSLFFFREYLCIHLYRQHFRKGILEMKESCPLPKEISKGLNVNGRTLLPGSYTVVEVDGYFRVDVDFK